MKERMTIMRLMILCPAFVTLFAASRAPAEDPALPVKVSPNGRYFIGQDGKPLFWLGTTQWELFRGYSRGCPDDPGEDPQSRFHFRPGDDRGRQRRHEAQRVR